MDEYEYTEHWMQRIVDRLDRLIEIGERVEGQVRLPSEEEAKTVADVLMDDACIPSDAVADEPPKKWRILGPGEVVQEGDLMNSKLNPPSDPPNGGWLAATSFCFGKEASFYSGVYFARPVADELAKEAEPEYREPVLPADCGKQCEFSDDGIRWFTLDLAGFNNCFNLPWLSRTETWRYARIKKDA